MDRRAFIHRACMTCASAAAGSWLLSSCASARHVTGRIDGDDLLVPASELLDVDGRSRPYVVASHGALKNPIAIFPKRDGGFSAVLMRCTHRGAELQVVGERLECAAHGSLFAQDGAVIEGPASAALRTFPVAEREGFLRISLKA